MSDEKEPRKAKYLRGTNVHDELTALVAIANELAGIREELVGVGDDMRHGLKDIADAVDPVPGGE